MKEIGITEHTKEGEDLFKFRKKTLIDFGKIKIVVSTIGKFAPYKEKNKFEIIGADNRMYETLVFYEGGRQIDTEGMKWSIHKIDKNTDKEAMEIHKDMVRYISNKLWKGEIK